MTSVVCSGTASVINRRIGAEHGVRQRLCRGRTPVGARIHERGDDRIGVGARVGVVVTDIVAGILLIAAVAIAVRPSSAVRQATVQWWRLRQLDAAAKAQWTELARDAHPLYSGHDPPDIVEVTDYECPFCRAVEASVDSARSAGLRIAILHMPLPSHRMARPAALEAVCAARNGTLSEVHRHLMQTSTWRTDAGSMMPPSLSSAQVAALQRCVADPEASDELERHAKRGKVLGVFGTPMFLSAEGLLRERPTADALARRTARLRR